MDKYSSIIDAGMNERDHFKSGESLKSRAYFFILTLMLSCISICAQDVITLSNGDEIKAKVTEISSKEIKYKRWYEKVDGPTIVIPSTDVFFIDLEDGTREIITPLSQTSTAQNTTNKQSNNSSTSVISELKKGLSATRTPKNKVDNNSLLRELTKKGNKVYIIMEAVDPAENSEKTIKYIEDNYFPQPPNELANFSYWKIVNDIKDADFVLEFTWFKIYGYNSYGGRTKVYDRQMNFLYTPVTNIRSLKKFASHIQNADLSKASPFYVETGRRNTFDYIEFEKYYHLLMESVQYKQNKKILEYANKCISINPDFPKVYEIKMAALLDMNKKTKTTFTKWIELDPLNQNVELFWQLAGNQNIKRKERNASIWAAVALSVSVAADTYAAIQTSSTATTTSYSQPTTTSSSYSQPATTPSLDTNSQTKNTPCHLCASNLGRVWAYTNKGNGKCVSCNSKGQRNACVNNPYGGHLCSDPDCARKNHRCEECGGTNICQSCKGTGYLP